MSSAKKNAKKPKVLGARAHPEVDPRVQRLLDGLRVDPKLAPIVAAHESGLRNPGRAFGKNGLKTASGKLFALFTQGTLVVKLSRERVVALQTRGVGKPLEPGHGRVMKEWITVTDEKASWLALAREAHELVTNMGHSKRS